MILVWFFGALGSRYDVNVSGRSDPVVLVYAKKVVEYKSAIGLVVKYLVAIEMPRVRFPDGAAFIFLAALFFFWHLNLIKIVSDKDLQNDLTEVL